MNPSRITLSDHLGHILFHIKCSTGLPTMFVNIEMLKNQSPAISKDAISLCTDFTAVNFKRVFSPCGLHVNMQIEYIIQQSNGVSYILALEASVYFGQLTAQITACIKGDLTTNEHVILSLLPARDALRGCNEIVCRLMRNPQNDYHATVKQIIYAAGSTCLDNQVSEYLAINDSLYRLAAQVGLWSEEFWTQWRKLAAETFVFKALDRKAKVELNNAIHDFIVQYDRGDDVNLSRIKAIIDPLIVYQELPRMRLVCKCFANAFGCVDMVYSTQDAAITTLPKEILLNIFSLVINVEGAVVSCRTNSVHRNKLSEGQVIRI